MLLPLKLLLIQLTTHSYKTAPHELGELSAPCRCVHSRHVCGSAAGHPLWSVLAQTRVLRMNSWVRGSREWSHTSVGMPCSRMTPPSCAWSRSASSASTRSSACSPSLRRFSLDFLSARPAALRPTDIAGYYHFDQEKYCICIVRRPAVGRKVCHDAARVTESQGIRRIP